jgi:Holliday junction resolvase RusA-like endonuclease
MLLCGPGDGARHDRVRYVPRPGRLALSRENGCGAVIDFFVPGIPKSTQTGHTITVNGRSFPLRRGTPWSTTCGLVARQYAPPVPLEGPLVVFLSFTMPAPKKTKNGYPRRPDLGNASKGLLDAFNGVLWGDDSQIVRLIEGKAYGAQPGVRVYVKRPDEARAT